MKDYYHPYPWGLELILGGMLTLLGASLLAPPLPQSQATPQSQALPSQTINNANIGDRYALLWLQEGGGCQNWSSDTQNRGGSAYTCLGITQSAWETYLRGPGARLNLPPTTIEAYRKLGEAGFKSHAIAIYEKQYCQPISCQNMPAPMPALMLAISANGGPGTARRWLNRTKEITNPKERAQKIAELEHARLDAIANRSPSQRKFRRGGWDANIRNRYAYIAKF